MKKIIALLLGFVMLFSAFAVSAKVPEFLTDTYNNYTADYNTRVQFKGADAITSLLKETGMEEEVNRYVDLGKLIDGLLSSESDVNIQIKMNEDYSQIDMALTADAKQKIAVNTNLNADVKYSAGLWIHADFTLEEPELELVYLTPIQNKYGVVNIMDYVSKEEVKDAYELFKTVVNPELVSDINASGATILEKYADIKKSGNRYTIHLDNNGFVKMTGELMSLAADKLFSVTEVLGNEYGETTSQEMREELEALIPDTLEILGKKGITYVYELNPQGKIRNCTLSADIKLNIAQIYTQMTGQPWEYSSQGEIEVDVTSTMDITNIGKTKPDFPVLTEENSYKSEFFDGLYLSNSYNDSPQWYVSGYMDSEITKDGLLYFPLEKIMHDCYGKNYISENADGIITMESDYFSDIEYATVCVGLPVANTNSNEYNIGEVLQIDQTVYVSEKFFTDILGWELDSYTVDLITGEVYYDFSTNILDYEDDYIYEDEEDWEKNYPNYYAWGYYNGLVQSGETYYVPLRATLDDAYDANINIVYSNGTVTIDSPWFTDFQKITLNVEESTAQKDLTSYCIGEVKVIDGSVYVSVSFFEDIFGWSLEYITYDRIYNETEYEFSTNKQ